MNSEVEKMSSKTSISFITNEVLLDAVFELEVVTVAVKESNLCTLYWRKKEAVEVKVSRVSLLCYCCKPVSKDSNFLGLTYVETNILERVPE